MSMTYQDKLKREKAVLVMLEEGMSISKMATACSITQQSMHRFLQVRGWKTKEMKRRDDPTQAESTKAERKAKRIAMPKERP